VKPININQGVVTNMSFILIKDAAKSCNNPLVIKVKITATVVGKRVFNGEKI